MPVSNNTNINDISATNVAYNNSIGTKNKILKQSSTNILNKKTKSNNKSFTQSYTHNSSRNASINSEPSIKNLNVNTNIPKDWITAYYTLKNKNITQEDKLSLANTWLENETFKKDSWCCQVVFDFACKTKDDSLCAKTCDVNQLLRYVKKRSKEVNFNAADFITTTVLNEQHNFFKNLSPKDKKKILQQAKKFEKTSDYEKVGRMLYGDAEFNVHKTELTKAINNKSYYLLNDFGTCLFNQMKKNVKNNEDIFADPKSHP